MSSKNINFYLKKNINLIYTDFTVITITKKMKF